MSSFRHAEREQTRSATQVNHDVFHPNGTRAHSHWAQDQTLHVAVMYSNPRRFRTRTYLCNDAIRHFRCMPNVKLYVGELAYGDRPFEVTSANHPLDFQFRTKHELWLKENILNLVIQRFDPGWEYGAWIDADFNFTRHDVALETIHMLQHHQWVQMFSTYTDLSPTHRPMRIMKSFANRFNAGELSDDVIANYNKDGYGYGHKGRRGVGTTGGAWAFRHEAFEACGGLLDTCILGSGDWHCAFGLAGIPDWAVKDPNKIRHNYATSIMTWQERAARATLRDIGCVDCHAIHHWHGSKSRRGYGTRWKILFDNNYDPYTDLFRDSQGVYQLRPERIKLRDDIRKYFLSRSEDDQALLAGDRELGD